MNKIIGSLHAGFVAALSRLYVKQLVAAIGKTPLVSATESAASASVSQCFGRVQCKKAAAGTATAPVTFTINNACVTANSVIIPFVERDSTSLGTVEYVTSVTNGSRVAGVSFQVDIDTKTTTHLAQNEGCTINYLILN